MVSPVAKISSKLEFWKTITSDTCVLNCVQGYKIEFETTPFQLRIPKEIQFSLEDDLKIELEISKFSDNGFIEPACHSEDEFMSKIFIRPKRNGGIRIILNLTELNRFVKYEHFKMEHLSNVPNLLDLDCYLGSVDLKDAYYSVPIHKDDRKYLRFNWKGKLFQFTGLPNGLACAPRVFTKVMKPVFSKLRGSGLMSIVYLDDTLLIGTDKLTCQYNIDQTVKSLISLGFTINFEKSSLCPSTSIEFLGFVLDSHKMTVKLTDNKIERITSFASDILREKTLTIRMLASFIGLLVSSFPGVLYGPP